MGVKKVGEKYRCNVCGNEVTVTKVGGASYAVVRRWRNWDSSLA